MARVTIAHAIDHRPRRCGQAPTAHAAPSLTSSSAIGAQRGAVVLRASASERPRAQVAGARCAAAASASRRSARCCGHASSSRRAPRQRYRRDRSRCCTAACSESTCGRWKPGASDFSAPSSCRRASSGRPAISHARLQRPVRMPSCATTSPRSTASRRSSWPWRDQVAPLAEVEQRREPVRLADVDLPARRRRRDRAASRGPSSRMRRALRQSPLMYAAMPIAVCARPMTCGSPSRSASGREPVTERDRRPSGCGCRRRPRSRPPARARGTRAPARRSRTPRASARIAATRPSAGSANARPDDDRVQDVDRAQVRGLALGGVALDVVEAAQLLLHPLRGEPRARSRTSGLRTPITPSRLLGGGQRLVEPAAPEQRLDAQPLAARSPSSSFGSSDAAWPYTLAASSSCPAHASALRLATQQLALAGGVPRAVGQRDLRTARRRGGTRAPPRPAAPAATAWCAAFAGWPAASQCSTTACESSCRALAGLERTGERLVPAGARLDVETREHGLLHVIVRGLQDHLAVDAGASSRAARPRAAAPRRDRRRHRRRARRSRSGSGAPRSHDTASIAWASGDSRPARARDELRDARGLGRAGGRAPSR